VNNLDLTTLVQQHFKPLVLFARQWDETTAEDAVHDVFVRLAGLVRDNQPPRHVVSWLYRAVRNRAIDAFRKNRQKRKHAEILSRQSTEWFTPQIQSDEKIDAQMLTTMMRQLPRKQREIITAHLWGELTFRQIAALVGRPDSSVRRDFYDGLKTLREKLLPDNFEEPLTTPFLTPEESF
jgi:RNA polymerase sigma-70 factor (ECF subfamily)